MSLTITSIFTGKELEDALATARTIVAVGYSNLVKNEKRYKKSALKSLLKEAHESNAEDKLEYIYRFLMHLSLLSEKKGDREKAVK